MAVTEDNTGVYVVFQFKHRGHDFELGRVFLSKSERAAIADKLREGVSMDAVLDNVRSNMDETFHRINLLSKQDLRNIMRDARVSKTERLRDNDYVSVQLWVERMHSERKTHCSSLNTKDNLTKSDVFLEKKMRTFWMTEILC
nr:uncharacterized protein LOC129387012 [Dermacentor andersoni]